MIDCPAQRACPSLRQRIRLLGEVLPTSNVSIIIMNSRIVYIRHECHGKESFRIISVNS